MLVLTRRPQESIQIDTALVSVLRVTENRATIGITAPKNVKICRTEIIDGSGFTLPPEDITARGRIMARLRKMDTDKRQEVIANIVREFCGKLQQDATECERYLAPEFAGGR